MSKQETFTVRVKSIAKQHQLLGLPKPKHPLISLLRFEYIPKREIYQRTKLISDLYQITLKEDCPCKLQYGQTSYDFDEGVMSFFSPKQVNILKPGDYIPKKGWTLSIHPDFLRTYPLDRKIKSFSFFNYAIHEALILSDDEQKSIETLFTQILKELNLPIDRFSRDVIVSNLDLLLTYCNRYFHRQFITRKQVNNQLVIQVEDILNQYLQNTTDDKGLPTASFLASQVNLSTKYLNDILKQLTGQTTQQLIHEMLIEKAKESLTTTHLSVGEIAYQLGFEYPQSFSKFFRTKTKLSPSEYRQSFN